jgi:DNA-binding NarL/FixJ family response regulator
VVLVEDHPMMVVAIRSTLERDSIEVVATAGTAGEAYELIGRVKPDVAVLDIGLPDQSGIELTRRLLQRDSRLGVVLHTGIEDPVALKDALECGASGFVYKTGPPDCLVTAVRTVGAGGAYVANELREAIAAHQRSAKPRTMTDRERQVLRLVADGLSNEQIAAELMLSAETVRTHVRNAMHKLGTHTRAHAVVEALRNEEIVL